MLGSLVFALGAGIALVVVTGPFHASDTEIAVNRDMGRWTAAFDALYVKSRALLPASPERALLFLDMTRQMEVDGAWSLHVSRERNQLLRPWVKGYKKNPILQAEFIYMDLEPRN